jgi:hypothetical protein
MFINLQSLELRIVSDIVVQYFDSIVNSNTSKAPISSIVRPVIQYVYPESHSIFSKEPSDEVNSAWAELVARELSLVRPQMVTKFICSYAHSSL